MENKIHFRLSTAGGDVCDEMVRYVGVPFVNGEAGILAGHAPIIGALKAGVVKYTVDNTSYYAAISGGVLSMADNELMILAESAEKAESIDLARAQASEQRARVRLEAKSSQYNMDRAELSLRRSLARQKAYRLGHGE